MKQIAIGIASLTVLFHSQMVAAEDKPVDYAVGVSVTNQQERYIWLDYSYEDKSGWENDWYFAYDVVTDPANPDSQTQLSYSSTVREKNRRKGYEYRYWANPGDFYTYSLIGIYEVSQADSAVIYKPRLSWIRVYSTFPTTSISNFLSPGFEVILESYHDESWTSSWTFGLNLYPGDSSKLSGGSKTSLSISRRNLDLATALDRLYIYYDLSYSADKYFAGVTFSLAQSAFDNTQSSYILLYSDFSLSKQLELELSLGKGSAEAVTTAEIGISYRW